MVWFDDWAGDAFVYARTLWGAAHDVMPFGTLLAVGVGFFMAPKLVRVILRAFGGAA